MDQTVQDWLTLQCAFVEDVCFGVVLLGKPETGPFEVMGCWPPDKKTPAFLESFSQKHLTQNAKSHDYAIDKSGSYTLVCCNIVVGSSKFGAITLLIKTRDKAKIDQTIKNLDWGSAWFSWLAKERKQLRKNDDRLVGLIEIIVSALKYESASDTANHVVNTLKKRLECGHVVLGLHNNILAQTAGDISQELLATQVAHLELALQEVISHQSSIQINALHRSEPAFPQHQQLMDVLNANSITSIPLVHNGHVIGALLFLNLKDNSLDDVMLRFYEQAALLIAPIIKMKQGSMTLPKQHRQSDPIKRRAAIIGAMLLTIGLSFINIPYQVTSKALVESKEKQVIAAPADGFLVSAHVQAGAIIHKDELLAQMDDRDLLLEKEKWKGKYAQQLKSYNSALAEQDRVLVSVQKAKLDQAQSELDSISNQLERLSLRAPYDGVVVSGDLSQLLGSPVKRGDNLFIVAKDKNYYLILEADERDLTDINSGQSGLVLLSSIPNRDFAFQIDRITPVARTADGNHYFQVIAELSEQYPNLSPGMTGIAKIDAGKRPIYWILFNRTYHWLRFLLWKI